MHNFEFTTLNEDETINLGKEVAKGLNAGDILAIYGDLGSGKTEFVKGICEHFKVEEIVTSPTFTIVNKYNGISADNQVILYHIDLYRIEKESELLEIGFEEYLNDRTAITLIEWAEKTSLIPDNAIQVKIFLDEEDDNKRLITIKSPKEFKIGM